MKTKMMIYFCLFLLLTAGLLYVAQRQQAPTGVATGYKKPEIDESSQRVRSYTRYEDEASGYPEYRAPAEFEKNEGIIVHWRWWGDYGEPFRSVYLEIVREAQTEGIVYIITYGSDEWDIRNCLEENNVPLDNIRFIQWAHITGVAWMRDFGPFFAEQDSNRIMLDLVYPPDGRCDAFPRRFLHRAYLEESYEYEEVQLKLDGGNFMTNGDGLVVCTESIIEENCDNDPFYNEDELNEIILNKFGGELVTIKEALNPHIDMHCKFINNNTVLVSKGPYGEQEDNEAYRELEENAVFLRNIDNRGKSLNVVRIPVPPGGKPAYTNSLIINRKVLVPIYGCPEDNHALDIYNVQMPGYQIIGIDCSNVAGGAIHCMTKEIPDDPKALRALYPAGRVYDRTPLFQWTKVPGVDDYCIQIWESNQSREHIRLIESEEVSFFGDVECSWEPELDLEAGIYVWRVGTRTIPTDKWSDYLIFRLPGRVVDGFGTESIRGKRVKSKLPDGQPQSIERKGEGVFRVQDKIEFPGDHYDRSIVDYDEDDGDSSSGYGPTEGPWQQDDEDDDDSSSGYGSTESPGQQDDEDDDSSFHGFGSTKHPGQQGSEDDKDD